jgi:hypothetical protein
MNARMTISLARKQGGRIRWCSCVSVLLHALVYESGNNGLTRNSGWPLREASMPQTSLASEMYAGMGLTE